MPHNTIRLDDPADDPMNSYVCKGAWVGGAHHRCEKAPGLRVWPKSRNALPGLRGWGKLEDQRDVNQALVFPLQY